MEKPTKIDKKTEQFTEELNELFQRYQLRLVADLRITSLGITPQLRIVPIIPQKKTTEPEKK
jgi:hypothetical protein